MSSSSLHLNSRNYYHSQIASLHSILYSKDTSAADLFDFIEANYEESASYINPFVQVQERSEIARQFSPLAHLPGELESELDEIYQSDGYGGNRTFIFSHNLTFSLFEQDLRSRSRSVSAYSSYPATPFSSRTPRGSPKPQHARLKVHKNMDKTPWPLQTFLSRFSPRNLALSFTTFDFRVHTRVCFNERGRIVWHEDMYGIKELIEALFPVLDHLYHIQRRALGGAVAAVASMFIKDPSTPEQASEPARISTDSDKEEMADDEADQNASDWSGHRGLGLTSP